MAKPRLKCRVSVFYFVIAAAVVVGLAADAWNDDSRGGAQLARLDQEIRALDEKLSELDQEKSFLEERNKKLSGETVDLDLLDERRRAVFGELGSQEVLIVPAD